MESRLVAVPEPDILNRDEEAAVDHARRFLNALGVRCDTPDTLNTPPRTAMEIVGHTTLEMTMNVYGHVNLESKRQAMDRLGSLFSDEGEAE